MKQYIVNAFAEEGFKGNPAAVVIAEAFPSEKVMQQIAAENNLSETAFCVCIKDDELEPVFHIRWFTPGCEVDLCGHATLATSYILFSNYFKEAKTLHFQSRSGELHVTKENIPAQSIKKEDIEKEKVAERNGAVRNIDEKNTEESNNAERKDAERKDAEENTAVRNNAEKNNAEKNDTVDFIVQMDFPAYGLERVTDVSEIEAVIQAITGCDLQNDNTRGCGTKSSGIRRSSIREIYKGIDYVAVLEKPEDVIGFRPDFEKIKALPGAHNLLITASLHNQDTEPEKLNGKVTCPKTASPDFVSRCFFPKEAIDEDPVTGSAHCTLGPLWAKKLGKMELTAYQASKRGGILHLKISENRVQVGGKAKHCQS